MSSGRVSSGPVIQRWMDGRWADGSIEMDGCLVDSYLNARAIAAGPWRRVVRGDARRKYGRRRVSAETNR